MLKRMSDASDYGQRRVRESVVEVEYDCGCQILLSARHEFVAKLKHAMFSNVPPKVLLIVAATLDVGGGLLIVFSLPDGGQPLWLGVGLIAVGSLTMRRGMARMNAELELLPDALEETRPGGADVEPELKKPAPRSVELTRRGKIVAAIWVAVVLLVSVLAYQHSTRLPPPRAKALLTSEGVSATATINRKERRSVETGTTQYVIGYNFTEESGSSIRSTQTVPRAVFESFAEGEELKVLYFPPDPSIHYLPEITSPITDRVGWLAIALLVAAAGFADAQRRTHKDLVTSGRAISGFVANVQRRGGVRSFLVNYDVGDQRRSIKAAERNTNLKNGQSATVLYDPKRLDRAVVYRIALYRAR